MAHGYPWPPRPIDPHQHRNDSIFIVIGVVVATLTIGLPAVFILSTLPGIGPGIGPGATPLGAVLATSVPAPQCPDAPAQPQLCNFTMTLMVYNATLTSPDLEFELDNSTGSIDDSLAGQVILSTAGGCEISIWTFVPGSAALGNWTAAPGTPSCPAMNLLQPIVTGDLVTVTPNPSNAGGLGGQGYAFVILANSGYDPEFDGTIGAPLL